ncbi:hypothetical protein [Parasitella parasitica]|uniref:ATP-dependent DNA helicase n=2 Tax=Parasitella parasitica TaxID=35722 RepID=A0A0B7NEQ1_9FUNG|nr:hypothetical protein [Parasitella parasitica]
MVRPRRYTTKEARQLCSQRNLQSINKNRQAENFIENEAERQANRRARNSAYQRAHRERSRIQIEAANENEEESMTETGDIDTERRRRHARYQRAYRQWHRARIEEGADLFTAPEASRIEAGDIDAEKRRRNAEYQRAYRERQRGRTQVEQEEEQNETEKDNGEFDLYNVSRNIDSSLVPKDKLFEWRCSQLVADKAFQLEPTDESERSLWTLQRTHSQYRSKGGIVNVPVSVDTTVQSIPRRLDKTNIIPAIWTRRMRYNGGYIKGNISIQKPGLDKDELNAGSTENSIASDEALRISPGEGRSPIAILVDRASNFLASPKIFTGQRLGIPDTLTYTSICKSLARSFDRSAVSRVDYLIFMDHQAFRVLQGIRSSSEYWKTERKNLMGMIRQFGIPTFFIALSAAETKWCKLLVMPKKVVDGGVISEIQAELLPSREKSRLLQSDPLTCPRYFDYRFRELKKTWKTCEDGPFVGFDWIEYFFRIEFQHRGSPHVHMHIWLEDVPSIPANDSDENDARFCDFINTTITCEREWDGSPHTWNQENTTAESWADLLRRQMHRHTATCRRRWHGQVVCRFNISFLPINETMILRPISPDEQIENHDQEAYRQKYKRIWVYLNEISEALVASNTTFEDFLGTNDITNVEGTLKELYERRARDPNSDFFDTLRSIATTYYNASEISAQEAVYNLLRIRMSEASTGCIHIPTARPENRQHILRDLETLGMMDPESTDCYQPGLTEHYTNRPSSRSTRRDNEHEDQENEQSDARTDDIGADARTDGAGADARNDNAGGPIKRRKESKVIRYYKFNKNDESRPDYFRTLLMLYKPWRSEETELLNVNAEEVVNINSGLIVFNFQEFIKIDEDALGDYMQQLMGDRQKVNEDEDENENERGTADDKIDDFGGYTIEDLSGGTSTTRQTYFEKVKFPKKLSDEAYHRLLSILNAKQRLFLTHVIHHIRYNKDETIVRYFDTSAAPDSNNTFSPMHLLVTGGAGTGKSMLINVLYESLIREFDKNRDRDMEVSSVLLGAPTGMAAFKNGDQTIHSIFDFPKNQGALSRLSAEVLHSMVVALKDVQVIITDEISIVSVLHFDWIDKRLKDLFHPQKPFVGKTFIFFGDLNRLPHVRGSAFYTKNVGSHSLNPNVLVEIVSIDNWGLFKLHKFVISKMYIYTQYHYARVRICMIYSEKIMRQREEHYFAVALNNLAIGEMTERNIALFQSRVYRMPRNLLEQMKNFSGISLPDDMNNYGINGNSSSSMAFDIVLGNQSYKAYILSQVGEDKVPQDVEGLIKNLKLKVNGEYMMSINVHTADSLVKGATCILKRIDYGCQNVGTRKSLRLWVEFEHHESAVQLLRTKQAALRRNLHIRDTWSMIEPYTTDIYTNNRLRVRVKRTQFSLLPSEALTIHKSQGQTFKSVLVVDGISCRRLFRQLLYVGCSRANSSSDLTILCKDNTFNPPTPLRLDR